MACILRRFRADKSGAITVDYIVLTCAIVGLTLTTVNAVSQGTFEGITDMMDQVKPHGCAVTQGSTTYLSACN